MTAPTTTTHAFTLRDDTDSVTVTIAAPTRPEALALLEAAGWEIWRRDLQAFPKLAVGETGDFEGHAVTRVTCQLYRYASSPLRYSKANMIHLMLNKPTTWGPARPMKRGAVPINPAVDAMLLKIAVERFNVTTLEAQHSDSLDFHDVHVSAMRKALAEAYTAGVLAAAKG